MPASPTILPEATLLSARWISVLLVCCRSSIPARFYRFSHQLNPFNRAKSRISVEKSQFLDGMSSTKHPPIVATATVRHKKSSVKTSLLLRAVDLPRLRHAVIGGQAIAPRGITASRQGCSYDAEDDRQLSRPGRNSDLSTRQWEVIRLRH